MADLEDEVGVRLLERGHRRTDLTEPGKIFLEHARRVLEMTAPPFWRHSAQNAARWVRSASVFLPAGWEMAFQRSFEISATRTLVWN